jgi:penicillin amidase
MTRLRSIGLVLVLAMAPASVAAEPVTLPGLLDSAEIVRDGQHIPHIFANNEHDLAFLQGWAQAQDRLFQMDVARRRASGTLAALLGPDSLAEDVELRTLGLRRAAERSLPLLSPDLQELLQAYADGVNAYAASHPLPPEYADLELTALEPWTALDSVAVAKLLAFALSFDLTDPDLTLRLLQYQATGALFGFDGTALFFEDLFRIAPFDPAAVVPDASESAAAALRTRNAAPARKAARKPVRRTKVKLAPGTARLLQGYVDRIRKVPMLEEARTRRGGRGSNAWVLAGTHTANGLPLLASDPHQPLSAPALFHQVHLSSPDLEAAGNSLAGTPLVVLGHNRRIAWGATTNPMDATDFFIERVVSDSTSPSGLSIVHAGQREHILSLPQVFLVNRPDDGALDNLVPAAAGEAPSEVLIVPRRNNGPMVAVIPLLGIGLSIQYTGFAGTREIETLYAWNRAENLDDFVAGLRLFDFGSQNFVYADVDGNIAYFTSGAVPLREDLEAGQVAGFPPYFLRNGQTGNEWLPEPFPPAGQVLPYKLLPFEEMPQAINPPAGFIVTANNDPNGNTRDNDPLNRLRPSGGILYLNPAYVSIRAGRIAEVLHERLVVNGDQLSIEDMQALQADVALLDAKVLVPHILRAFDNANRKGAPLLLWLIGRNPRIVEAVGRLRAWDFTTPTGVTEGYDVADLANAPRTPPDAAEIADSVAATIYAVWRDRALSNIVDRTISRYGLAGPDLQEIPVAALRHLLESFDANQGIGKSGLDFFPVFGIAGPADRRDYLLLKSLRDALDLLAGNAFAAAFHGSTDQDDYRWGRLHRVVLAHELGEPYSVPPAGGAFPPPFGALAGIPTDGGFETVDASRHDPRAADAEAFTFDSGPANRFTAQIVDGRMTAATALPGGESGDVGSPHSIDLLAYWLVNDAYPLLTDEGDIDAAAASHEVFLPAVVAGAP